VTFVAFDLLEVEGRSLLRPPDYERRLRLRTLLDGGTQSSPPLCLSPAFEDGTALFPAVCEQGLEGIVAKRLDERYRPGERRSVKVKNRDYWRYPIEVESVRRSVERRVKQFVWLSPNSLRRKSASSRADGLGSRMTPLAS
jgi:ATP-dependent DNA ligase